MDTAPKDVIQEQIDRIREELKNHEFNEVAVKAGLHRNTVRNIAHGLTVPSMANIEKLSNLLFAKA